MCVVQIGPRPNDALESFGAGARCTDQVWFIAFPDCRFGFKISKVRFEIEVGRERKTPFEGPILVPAGDFD